MRARVPPENLKGGDEKREKPCYAMSERIFLRKEEAAMAEKDPAIRKKAGAVRDKKGRFVKGQSGNISGRASIPDDIKQAFKEASKDACELLCKIVNDDNAKDSDRIRAAEVILDRGWGKPVQAVDLDAKNIPQVVFTGYGDIAD